MTSKVKPAIDLDNYKPPAVGEALEKHDEVAVTAAARQ